MIPEDILVFQRGAREDNDANNKKREEILEMILTAPPDFFQDAEHGARWQSRRTAWREALLQVARTTGVGPVSNVTVERMAGRGHNYDFRISFHHAGAITQRHVEYKFGAGDVTSLPQILSVGANKPFHENLYAAHFYETSLDKLLEIHGISPTLKPTKEVYLKFVHNNSKTSNPLWQALYESETTFSPDQKKSRDALITTSITSFLESNLAETNISSFTAELERTQKDKFILLDDGTTFSFDTIHPQERKITTVIGLNKQKNSILLQTARPGTTYSALLRWKNHKGILFPAWQIKIMRSA
jgi:hypothetical protein